MKLVFMGPPGVGKGTQAARIAQKYSLEHISTGELLRNEIAAATPVGRHVETLINHGQLISDELMIELLSSHLKTNVGGYILDGFPRTLRQAKELSEIESIDAAVYYTANKDAIIARLSARRVCSVCKHTFTASDVPDGVCTECGGAITTRDDDKPDVVSQRLEVYNTQTLPIIEYYKGLGTLITVDAHGTVKDVFDSTVSLLTQAGIR